jgi:pimeloyl-ACP methyl ester carboxylesterase
MKRPIVLVHGYSDRGKTYEAWKRVLTGEGGYKADGIHICSYESLVNEINIDDIAEGFESILASRGIGPGDEFDAIVHSTGMLVIRAWLTRYGSQNRRRLKHLIGLAPATFGSPLAHKGRSFLGAIFKSNRRLGPDFMETGDQVLDALELGSRFTWDLAHRDLLADPPVYGPDARTPYPFVLCGADGYTGLASVVNSPGTDGTVRWAGAAFDTYKFTLDLTEEATAAKSTEKPRLPVPVYLIEGVNHGTIASDPTATKELVLAALSVDRADDFRAWCATAEAKTRAARTAAAPWQQFILKVSDERGCGVSDYHLEFFTKDENRRLNEEFDIDVHPYSTDKSFRAFHVNYAKVKPFQEKKLCVRVLTHTGTGYATYVGRGASRHWSAEIDLPSNFFYPFTTSLVEIKLNREVSDIIRWDR